MLLSSTAISAVVETGLRADDFYYRGHGLIYATAVRMSEHGEPVDVLTINAELERRGALGEAGGTVRVRELAALVPATTNVAHHARLVREAAARRQLAGLADILNEQVGDGADPIEVADEAARFLRTFEERTIRSDFVGLSQAEALARPIPTTSLLVEDLIEAGTVGTIAALPESHKSFLAVEIAHKVAHGGRVLGRFDVLATGPVGYWWQDDSEANELRRLNAYARRHNFAVDVPLRWHLNEGLRLPDDLPALRREVEREAQVLVVLDSLYNFVRGGLKDEEAADAVAAIKRDLCDPTDCAVCIIDHTPWPTESNRGQRRAYGSVFKAAAIRWGIYIDREANALQIEARGNNIAGFPRSPVIWDTERLELRLADQPSGTERDLAEEIATFLRGVPCAPQNEVETKVKRRAADIRETLKADGRFTRLQDCRSAPAHHPNAACWTLTRNLVPGCGTQRDETPAGHADDVSSAAPHTPYGGVGARPRLGLPLSGPTDAREIAGEDELERPVRPLARDDDGSCGAFEPNEVERLAAIARDIGEGKK